MIYIYSLIFIITMALGAGLAWYRAFTPLEWVICMTISGFIGSSIIALVCTFVFIFF